MPDQPTEIAYSETNWSTCPNCDSDNIAGGSFDVDSNVVFQQVECRRCGTVWTEEYTAIMRTNIEYPRPSKGG